jgi:hypothetical protein
LADVGVKALRAARKRKSKGKRQKAKGKNEESRTMSRQRECLYFCLLPFAFCLLIFLFLRLVLHPYPITKNSFAILRDRHSEARRERRGLLGREA